MSSLPTRCPRCASRRIEGVATCPRCQWRYVAETAAGPSQWVTLTPPASERSEAASQPVSVKLEAMDRRAIARWSLAAFQVRCLGATGGCVGIIVGTFVGLVVTGALTHNALLTIPGLFIGGLVGMWAGILVALRLMAR